MPLLSLLSSAATPPPEARAQLFARLTRLLAEELGKPESYVMVALHPRTEMSFGGDAWAPCCYAELKNVGALLPERTATLSSLLCGEIAHALGVRTDRIYIEFTSADGAAWGWNGGTFA
jgi:phenylpyruvate tautomerase